MYFGKNMGFSYWHYSSAGIICSTLPWPSGVSLHWIVYDQCMLIIDVNVADEEADLTETVLKKAAKAVGSLSEKEFSIAFNPDLYQPKVTHSDPDGASLKTDQAMLNKITEFLVFHQIPAFVSVTCVFSDL